MAQMKSKNMYFLQEMLHSDMHRIWSGYDGIKLGLIWPSRITHILVFSRGQLGFHYFG